MHMSTVTALIAPTAFDGLLDAKIKAKGKKYFGSAADPGTIGADIDVAICDVRLRGLHAREYMKQEDAFASLRPSVMASLSAEETLPGDNAAHINGKAAVFEIGISEAVFEIVIERAVDLAARLEFNWLNQCFQLNPKVPGHAYED
ncbi:hypothetical protein DFH09DRAFT_1068618 [Mycena vulgaris]|nr:hypothetical protein DFH09DRAFT_1068618 [Mycena vulgaris]